ncbi:MULTISPECIES: integrase domain-containing protein [unclassified Paraburkholderia]|uniref:integrase domain-containing protein n=1 Tax=unclassified Paraburkholderia TaxID=2615204 RepID=UPI002AB1FD82|nr:MULTISPECIES: integrase domain-containing protein [unclassified Paraburkholderia]
MGKRAQGVHHATKLSKQLGGSLDTQYHRRLHWREFSRFCSDIGHTLARVNDAQPWMIELFIMFLVAGDMKPGTLANIRASLAVIHAGAGQTFALSIHSRSLKLERRDRSGKHRSLTPDEFHELVSLAGKIDEGLVHIISLMRWLGLRSREALMSARSLESWRDRILAGELRLPVERGAKNARPRETEVLPGRTAPTLAAVEAALAFAQSRNFELITGCHGDLKSAKSRLKALFDRLPMRGERGSHSLRYTFAQEFANSRLDQGTPPLDVLTELSDRLGHGPSRLKMILDVYCREIRHRFPAVIHLPSDFVATTLHRKTDGMQTPAQPEHPAGTRHDFPDACPES